MTFWAYMLRCADGSYYTGHTDNLDLRIAQHQHGEIEGYTQMRRPVELVWSQDFGTRIEALEAERRIKGWSRVKKEALIQGDWAAIQRLASRSVVLRDAPSLRSVAPQDERSVGVSVHPEEGLSVSEGPSRRASLPPIIVLVRPQLGENIGKAARAMLNFGLTELRLVAPRDGWPNPDAGPAAAGADRVLAGASVYATTAEAIADCTYVYATTVRKRGVTKPVVTPQQAAAEIVVAPGRTAILFGAERSGLETDDVAAAQSIITVPINPAFGSLNLAQAVILVAYEWSKHSAALVQPPMEQAEPPAPQAELEDMIQAVFAMLEERNYFYPPERTHATQLALRNLLTQGRWNSGQVRTMRGVFSAFQKDRQRGKRG